MIKPVVVTLCFLLAAAPAVAQQAAPAKDAPVEAAPPADAKGAVQLALKQYVAAFNSHDAAKLVELWAPDGSYVDRTSGERTDGRDALAADFQELFTASPDIQLAGQVEKVRVLSDDVAMVEGRTTTATPDAPPAVTAYSAVLVKRDGKWLLDSVNESAIPTPESPREALAPLEWLIGSWLDDAEDAMVITNTQWSPSEAFIVRSYSVERAGESPFSGTQVIGWDPSAKQIRSWTFSSDGSFGEGTWTRDGEEWIVRGSQTLPDGRLASGTQVINRVDDNTTTVQTLGKDIDGELQPASEPVTMRRVVQADAGDQAPVGPDNGQPASSAVAVEGGTR